LVENLKAEGSVMAADIAVAAPTNQLNARTTRVWLVDDDNDLVSLLEERFRSCGWQSRSFDNGDALDEALIDDMPHVLVLDRLLPGKNGTHLLTRIRQQGHRFPVLMLSALGTADQRIEGLETGADDYLAKPFLWRELQLRLERLLDYRRELTPQRPPEEIFQINDLLFDPSKQELKGPSGTTCSLSRGDASLLSFFCLSPGIAFEREQLCQATGSLVDANSSRSIDVRISKLRKLLNSCKRGSGRMIEAVRGRGYRLEAEVVANPTP
jgi:DNA-binding response OmpR family regulator